MTRVGRALALHELLERTRDRWVLVVSLLFAALASAVSAYGRGGGEADAAAGATLTGPSLVTLASLFVPLVALVLSHDAIVGERERNTLGLLLSMPVSRAEVVLAKFVGRGAALALSVTLGMGTAIFFASPAQRPVLISLVLPTLLLGLAFLAIGLLVSTLSARQSVAASLVVVVWSGMVFFYDIALLGLLVATDGGVSESTIARLVVANPAGLYRIAMMQAMIGGQALSDLGLAVDLPTVAQRAGIWTAWVLGPVALSALILTKKRVLR